MSIYTPTYALELPEIKEEVRKYYIKKYDLNSVMRKRFELIEEFKSVFLNWINTGNIKCIGLHHFPYVYVINGITDFIDQVIPEHKLKPIVLENEYPAYTFKALTCIKSRIKLDNKINVVSVPFYNDMSIHPATPQIIESNSIIDFAWAGNYSNKTEINVSKSSYVLHSLNKTFGLYNLRLGLCFSKTPISTFELYKDIPVVNLPNVELAIYLMKKFNPDYLYDVYHEEFKSKFIQNKIEPTASLWIGIKENKRYSIFDLIGKNYEKRK